MKDKGDFLYKIFGVILLVMAYLWYRSDNARIKYIENLQEEITQYELKLSEYEQEIEFLEDELKSLREDDD